MGEAVVSEKHTTTGRTSLAQKRLVSVTRRLFIDGWLLIAAMLAIIPLAAILQPGAPNTADGPAHVLRTFEVSRAFAAGSLYPRWAPDFYLGYGYPYSNFYAPGAHILAGLLALSGLGVQRGVLIVQAFALILYPTGAFMAARSLYAACLPSQTERSVGVTQKPWSGGSTSLHLAALLSAALYLYAPLRFHELFVQGNLSQWLALGLLPWCGWALTETARRGGAGWIGASAALLAGLVYAHHPTAFMSYPLLAVYTYGARRHLAQRYRPESAPAVRRNLWRFPAGSRAERPLLVTRPG